MSKPMYIVMGKPMAQKSESLNGRGRHRWEKSQITDLIFWRLIHHICRNHLNKYDGMSGKVAKMAFFIKIWCQNLKKSRKMYENESFIKLFSTYHFCSSKFRWHGIWEIYNKKIREKTFLGTPPTPKNCFLAFRQAVHLRHLHRPYCHIGQVN